MSTKEQQMNQTAKRSAIDIVFVVLILMAIFYGLGKGTMAEVNTAIIQRTKLAVTSAFGLVGMMAFWLGMIKVLEHGGALNSLSRALSPVMRKLFPEIPTGDPAISAMTMNIAANILGLANAATPFGLKAMKELQRLNPFPKIASNSMCMFLAINTSGVAVLPLGAIAIRANAGSTDAAGIFMPTVLATLCSTIAGVSVCYLLSARDRTYLDEVNEVAQSRADAAGDSGAELRNVSDYSSFHVTKISKKIIGAVLAGFAALLGVAVFARSIVPDIDSWASIPPSPTASDFSSWLMPMLVLAVVLYGLAAGVKVYESAVEGAKEGFEIFVKILPFFVIIFVMAGMIMESGGMDLLLSVLGPVFEVVGVPAEVAPIALLRPLSGSGSFALMSELVARDPNSYASFVASVVQGSTETTFYVVALYFGSVGVLKLRHALVGALLADFVGVLASGFFSGIFYGS